MSGSFPSMICNEPPPLDSEDEDSESFRDFPSAGLKLDILGEPSPQQSPIKSAVKKVPVSNGHNLENSPEKTHLEKVSAVVNGHEFEDVKVEEERSESVNVGTLADDTKEKCLIENSLSESNTSIHTNSELPDDSPADCADFHDCEPIGLSIEDVTSPSTSQDNSNSEETFMPVHNDPDEIFDAVYSTSQGSAFACDKVENNEPEEFSAAETDISETVVVAVSPTNEVEYKYITPPQELDVEDTIKETHEEQVSVESNNLFESDSAPFTSSFDDEKQTNYNDRNCDFQDFSNSSSSPSFTDRYEPTIDNDIMEDDFGDFEAAFSSRAPVTQQIAIVDDISNAQPSLALADDDFGDFETFQAGISSNVDPFGKDVKSSAQNDNMKTSYIGRMDVSVEPFGNFAEALPAVSTLSELDSSTSVQGCPNQNPNQSASKLNDDTEGFGDFEDFQSSSYTSLVYGAPTAASNKVLPDIENKLDLLVKAVFNTSESINELENKTIVTIDKELNAVETNEEWQHVQDFEGSQGLQFKWSNCFAHQKMLHSLKIDTTAVMYTGKWGTIEVPRFAASIVESPLQPKVFSNSTDSELLPTTPISNHQTAQDTASSQENVNTRKSQKPTGDRTQGNSEAQQILEQLPDLSFMRAKTLVFTSQIQD